MKSTARFLFLVTCLFGTASLQGEDISCRQKVSEIFTEDISALSKEDVKYLLNQVVAAKNFIKKFETEKSSKILHELKKITKKLHKTSLFGSSDLHKHKNIFSAPYDQTRALRDVPGFYISANDVYLPKQYYIVGEEPQKKNVSTFWEALLKANVKTVIALSTPSETAYYSNSLYPQIVDEYSIIKVSEEVLSISPVVYTQRIIKRIFWAMKGDEKRIITHLQLENWPDHGAAENTIFQRLVTYVQHIHPNENDPIFVHCAAGIGRSGTFIATHSFYKEIDEAGTLVANFPINIPLRIVQMRIQRKGMLGNKVQLQAVIDAIQTKLREKDVS